MPKLFFFFWTQFIVTEYIYVLLSNTLREKKYNISNFNVSHVPTTLCCNNIAVVRGKTMVVYCEKFITLTERKPKMCLHVYTSIRYWVSGGYMNRWWLSFEFRLDRCDLFFRPFWNVPLDRRMRVNWKMDWLRTRNIT